MDLFLLKKILTPFLLLPGLFILVLFLSGLWGLYRGRLGRSLGYICLAAMLWALAIPPVSDLAQRGLESGLRIPENAAGDVIIMMGGAIYENSPDISGKGIPSEGTWDRIVTVARLQRQLNVPIILTGGQVHADRAPMGPVYRRILTDLGVPEEQILIEGDSRDTIENALFSKAMCEAKGFRNPIVVTSAAHMKRTLLSFEKVGMTVTPFPCGFRTWAGKTYSWPDYLPGSYDPLSAALHEYMGLMAYRFAY